MEGVLNTSGQSNYHSCRASLEGGVVAEGAGDDDNGASAMEVDSTFVCNSAGKDTSAIMATPSSADVSDLGGLVQSNVIAESTRTSIMNGSGLGPGFGDDSMQEQPQLPVILAQKLTGGTAFVKSSTPCSGSSDSTNENSAANGSGMPGFNDCLINSALGCSASITEIDSNNNSGPIVSPTPFRNKQDSAQQQQQQQHFEGALEEDDLIVDDLENAAAVRQNRSGSFTVVREKALPGTPIIEDEHGVNVPAEDRAGSSTPPQRSPGLFQDSASRPLIPKAKNRRSIWTSDVFSPAMNTNGDGVPKEICTDPILLPSTAGPAATTASDERSSPLLSLNTTPPSAANDNNSSGSNPSPNNNNLNVFTGSATFTRSAGKMLLESVAASVDPTSVPIVSNDTISSTNGNHSYVLHASGDSDEIDDGIIPVVDAANVSAAMSSHSSTSVNRGFTPPVIDDGLVGAGSNLEFLNAGSSATITKCKQNASNASLGSATLSQTLLSPAQRLQACPAVPPASSSPKPQAVGNGTGVAVFSADELGKGDGQALCATPILPGDVPAPVVLGSSENGTSSNSAADDADRRELLARISQLELENSTLKSKMSKFEEINNQLVVSCSQLGASQSPAPSDLEEFHKFVHSRLQAAEEVSDDYRALEGSFNELHRRYERLRAVLAEAQARDCQLQTDIATMKQAADVADTRVASLMRESESKLAEMESENNLLKDNYRAETLKNELRVGQLEIEARNFQQQLQQKETQIADLNRLLASAVTNTARR